MRRRLRVIARLSFQLRPEISNAFYHHECIVGVLWIEDQVSLDCNDFNLGILDYEGKCTIEAIGFMLDWVIRQVLPTSF